MLIFIVDALISQFYTPDLGIKVHTTVQSCVSENMIHCRNNYNALTLNK